MARRIALGLIALAAASCTEHVVDQHPTISELGIGRVLSVGKIVGDTGESTASRYALGWAFGGPIGAIAAGNAQKDLSRSELFTYSLRLSDGATSTLRSFSIVAVNDCVKITKIGDKAEVVLEQIASGRCDVSNGK